MLNANSALTRWDTTALALPGAHRRWKAGLRTEVALDGLQFVIPQPQILHVAERLSVRGMTEVHHKCLVAAAEYPLQVKTLDKILLRLPALRFESALTDVVVTGCARKCEVVRQQDVDRLPVLSLPCRIPFADSLVAFRAESGLRVRTGDLRDDRRCSQCARARLENRPARHCSIFHDSFLPYISRP